MIRSGGQNWLELTYCRSRCDRLGKRGSYGLVTPVFESQYIGLLNFLNIPVKAAVWFGLVATESVMWNRYSPKQTVHSIAPDASTFANRRDNVIHWKTPSKFKLPIIYHHKKFAANRLYKEKSGRATCLCEKGEVLILSRGALDALQFIAPLGRGPRGPTDDYQVCACVSSWSL